MIRERLAALSARVGPDVAALGAIVIVALTAGVAILGSGRMGSLTRLDVGVFLAAAFASGVGAWRWWEAWRRAQAEPDRSSAARLPVLGSVALLGVLAAAAIAGAIVVVTRGSGPLRVAVLVGGVVAALVGLVLARRWPGVSAIRLALAGEVVAIWAVADVVIWSASTYFYDFRVYWAAGVHARERVAIYLPGPITELPHSASSDWFLYPPPLIPLLDLVTRLPQAPVAWVFAFAMAAFGVLAYRALGLSWRWSVLLLAFPPMLKGIESGNIANLTFLLFAGGVRWGPGLVLGALFKVQNVIPAAWLARERRWRDIAIGVALVAGVCLLTFPFVGLDTWRAWAAGLAYRQQSQVNLPILYGDSLAEFMPAVAFLALSAVAFLVAFRLRERRGLAGLGLASIIASPSLWPHGFVMAVPALLALPSSIVVWVALGIAGANSAYGLWGMTALASLGLVWGSWDRAIPEDPLHPLGGQAGPWPAARREPDPSPVALPAADAPALGLPG